MGTTHVAVVVDEGGACGAGPCQRTLELGDDGSWLFTGDDGSTTAGSYDEIPLLDLVAAADETALVLGPFRGECPTVRGGTERSYLVFRADGEPLVLGSCHDQLDAGAPLLEALDLLVVEAGR